MASTYPPNHMGLALTSRETLPFATTNPSLVSSHPYNHPLLFNNDTSAELPLIDVIEDVLDQGESPVNQTSVPTSETTFE